LSALKRRGCRADADGVNSELRLCRFGVRTAVLLVTLAGIPAVTVAQTSGAVRGEVIDESGAVLPGTTVVATVGQKTVASTVTDDAGRFAFDRLPSGPVALLFQLDGFDASRVDVVVKAATESHVVERLQLAQVTEQVVVYAPAPLPYVAPRRPPPPAVIPLPKEELETVCQPAKAGLLPKAIATIASHRYDDQRALYTKGDELNIDGGTAQGLDVGRNLVVRRYFKSDARGGTVEHTAGLIQIVSATDHRAIGVVVKACNEVAKGDFLAAFEPERVRVPEPPGTTRFDAAIRILFADDGQMMGSAGRFVVVGSGREQNIQLGQRLTLFRRAKQTGIPLVLGQAVVVGLRADSATLRVERANDAIMFGDWAAPQSPATAATSRER